MSNPFATPLKLGRRELDALRDEIATEQERLACLDAREAVLVAVRAAERGHASRDPRLPLTRWFERTERQRMMIARERLAAERALELLRHVAREKLGALTALEAAAERWTRERMRVRERREQAAADDRAAASYLARVA